MFNSRGDSKFEILFRRILAIAVTERGFFDLLPAEPHHKPCKWMQLQLLGFITQQSEECSPTMENPDATKRVAKDKLLWKFIEDIFPDVLQDGCAAGMFVLIISMIIVGGRPANKLFRNSKISERFVQILRSDRIHDIQQVVFTILWIQTPTFPSEKYFAQLHRLKFFDVIVRLWSAFIRKKPCYFELPCQHDVHTYYGNNLSIKELILMESIQITSIALTSDSIVQSLKHLKPQMLKLLRKIRQQTNIDALLVEAKKVSHQLNNPAHGSIRAIEGYGHQMRVMALPLCTKCDKRALMTEKFKICGRCRHARYCSAQCQADDWKTHQKNC